MVLVTTSNAFVQSFDYFAFDKDIDEIGNDDENQDGLTETYDNFKENE